MQGRAGIRYRGHSVVTHSNVAAFESPLMTFPLVGNLSDKVEGLRTSRNDRSRQ